MLLSTSAIREAKNSVAKEAEPTGWPRRRKPEVSSTGIGAADLSVGCGAQENRAIDTDKEAARVGSCVDRSGRMDDPLQEVRIRVLKGLTKQPS